VPLPPRPLAQRMVGTPRVPPASAADRLPKRPVTADARDACSCEAGGVPRGGVMSNGLLTR
jgi:hypothetical protein